MPLRRFGVRRRLPPILFFYFYLFFVFEKTRSILIIFYKYNIEDSMLNFKSYLNKLTRNNRIYYKLIYSRKNSNQSKKLKPKLNEKISNEPFFKNLCISRMISDNLPQNALRSNLGCLYILPII